MEITERHEDSDESLSAGNRANWNWIQRQIKLKKKKRKFSYDQIMSKIA